MSPVCWVRTQTIHLSGVLTDKLVDTAPVVDEVAPGWLTQLYVLRLNLLLAQHGKYWYPFPVWYLYKKYLHGIVKSSIFNKFLILQHLVHYTIIYRVSQKKWGLVFRARFEVFRGFKSNHTSSSVIACHYPLSSSLSVIIIIIIIRHHYPSS